MTSTWPGVPPRLATEGADASVNRGIFKRARRESGEARGHQSRSADSIDLSLARSDEGTMIADELLAVHGVKINGFVGEVATWEERWSRDRN
jgi:hypothetical protein